MLLDQAVTDSDQEVGWGSWSAELHGLWEGLYCHCQEGKCEVFLKMFCFWKQQDIISVSCLFLLLLLCSTIADIAETFSAPSVRRRTPSRHPLKSQYECVRHASRSSKADFPLTPLPNPNTPTPHPLSLPFLLQRAEEGVSLSYLMCTIKDWLSARTSTCMWPVALVWREVTEETPGPHDREGGGIGWDCLYRFLCLRYSCGLPESRDSEN